jgi:hypothetical protein
MNKRLRETVLALVALGVMLVTLVSINPRVRERAGDVTSSIQWDTSSSAVQHTFDSVVTAMSSYAGDNVYLFTFLVAACLLFVLMLRT